ncbi:MAG: 5'-nucleotidase C-terminal domain-containing protein [Saprospirales bacterium]|nr:5'-nucleotidase C-terminal domain-containing protein [Saprospirales bacterium]
MMSKIYSKIKIYFFVIASIFTACKTIYPTTQTASLVKINKEIKTDSATFIYYKPYKDSLDKIMKVALVELEEDLSKKLPESTLGNFMVDMLKIKTEEYTKDKIDVAILNYGGIRTPSLTKGILNVEHAYLLMPFDNYLVEQTLTGQQLADFCDSIAAKNGWPISGISFQIKNKKAQNILVDNEPISLTKKYNIAVNDYLANGGDGIALLKTIPQKQTGKLFRDAIIEYWKEQARLGKKVSAKIENRITNAE